MFHATSFPSIVLSPSHASTPLAVYILPVRSSSNLVTTYPRRALPPTHFANHANIERHYVHPEES